ncbi:hypothetical protein PV396_30605 [Streptomyces sp. ME02-8801-2C]|uniref:hypothetical protein n=1 Tax=Streptomyces sp. ME02-8801-2C TaxID=3028680 RepID=UPI0029A2D32F|nr:hypothetical protein [Streptomyces sp. ME02-8801-2C]MDX3456241.1 hypothetical protein [Streptomyces sp. ME02-8801-2C]
MPTSSYRGRLIGTGLAALAAGALAWTAVAGSGSAPAQDGAANRASGAVTAVADEAPAYAVETFDYPNADKILAEQNIVLKRGDGHITLADCASGTGLLEVWAREKADRICFKVVGNSGWLTMEIPSVYAVKGNDYATEVDMTVGAEEKSFDVEKNTWTAVGESADEQGREHMLVEIRSSK